MSLKFAILGLLSDGSRYGYEIKHEFEERLGDIWPVSYGQIYPTFKKLLDECLVIKETKSGKKAIEKNVYSITENGRDLLHSWLNDINKKGQISIKDEFTLSFFFYNKVSPEVLKKIIYNYENHLEKEIRKYRDFKNKGEHDNDSVSLIFNMKMLFHLEADKLWLGELKKLLLPSV